LHRDQPWGTNTPSMLGTPFHAFSQNEVTSIKIKSQALSLIICRCYFETSTRFSAFTISCFLFFSSWDNSFEILNTTFIRCRQNANLKVVIESYNMLASSALCSEMIHLLENNLYALITIVVISGEDAPTTGSTGAAQRIRTTGSNKATWRREKEDIP